MTVGRAFRRLTRVLRRLEEAGWDIDTVQLGEGPNALEEGSITAILECHHPDEEASAPPGLRTLELTDHPVQIDPVRVRTTADGVDVRIRVVVETTSQREANPIDSNGDPSPPLHQDRARLLRLFQAHPTFSAMADAADEDVSAETLRRYMIEHDIHEPGSSTVAHELHEEHPPVLADGMGSPLDGRGSDVIDAVADANTVYDVQRRLDIDRKRAREMLQELDLMDLVLGRLDDSSDRDDREREIRRRLTKHS